MVICEDGNRRSFRGGVGLDVSGVFGAGDDREETQERDWEEKKMRGFDLAFHTCTWPPPHFDRV